MPSITRLRPAERSPERVRVHIDGEYAFALPADVAASLREGESLTDERLAELRLVAEFSQALNRSMRFLGYRPRSRQELVDYLSGKKTAQDVAHRVVERLDELGYIDDEEFSRWWVENRCQHQPRGPWVLQRELSARGVPDTIAREAVAQIDEAELARGLALQRAAKYRGLDRPTFERRLGNLLLRRGFSTEVAHEAVRAAWREAGGEADQSAETSRS